MVIGDSVSIVPQYPKKKKYAPTSAVNVMFCPFDGRGINPSCDSTVRLMYSQSWL